MDCPALQKCPFFQDELAEMPSKAESLKDAYCKLDYAQCARWMVRFGLGPEAVPPDLFPDQLGRAYALVAGE